MVSLILVFTVVELGDDVVGHDAGLGRRRIVDRRHHLHQAVFHGDFDAEPAELAACLHLHVAEALGVHVARMWIEPGEHTVDRRFDEFAVVGFLDVIGAHTLEHVTEQIELPVGVRRGRFGARSGEYVVGLSREQREASTCDRAKENKGSFAHHPRTFSPSFVAHHGLGSMGVPSLRNST
jgi:hypothetical protein